MAHTVSGKLYKAPFIKQLTDSTMFAIKLSEVTKDRNTGEKSYVNYDAVLFAKTQAAVEFYTNATAVGSFVVVSCEKLQMKVSDCGQYTSLSMENARLDNANYPQSGQQQQAPAQQAPAQQAPMQQQAPQQQFQPQQQPNYNQQPQNAQQVQQLADSGQRQMAPQGKQQQYSEPPMDFDEKIPF